MSVLDKFLNAMKLNPDENDDFYEDDYYDEDEEEITPPKRKRKEKVKEEVEEEIKISKEKEKNSTKVTPIRTSKKQLDGWEMCVITPNSINEAKEITDTLLSNRPVVLNVEKMSSEDAQRIVDFASGSCCALQGNSQRISPCIFIFTPSNIDISGDSLVGADNFDSDSNIRSDF